jgi:hypothetical protein
VKFREVQDNLRVDGCLEFIALTIFVWLTNLPATVCQPDSAAVNADGFHT